MKFVLFGLAAMTFTGKAHGAAAAVTENKGLVALRYTINGTIGLLELQNDSNKSIYLKETRPKATSEELKAGQTVELSTVFSPHFGTGYCNELAKLFSKASAKSYLTMNIDNTQYLIKLENNNISHGNCGHIILKVSDILIKGQRYQSRQPAAQQIQSKL
jgi:hypothetical protein